MPDAKKSAKESTKPVGLGRLAVHSENEQRKATEGFKFVLEYDDKNEIVDNDDVETKRAKNGKVGYHVKCDNGRWITFWSHTMHEVLECIEVDGAFETYQVLADAKILDDGGLIPSSKVESGGFFTKGD